MCDAFGFEVYVGLNLSRGVGGAKCLWQRRKSLPEFENIFTVYLYPGGDLGPSPIR